MGCSPSKENDKSAVGSRSLGQTYDDQAEDAAAMLTTGTLTTRLQGLQEVRRVDRILWSS